MNAAVTIRILVAHEDRLYREALRALLRAGPGVEVVDEAPHLVLADLASLAEALVRDGRPSVIAIAGEEERDRALAAGAAAVVGPREGVDRLLAAVQAHARKDGALPRLGILEPRTPSDPLRRLTAREREIFTLVIRGLSTAAIARHLEVSPRTVETHRAHLSRKLGAHSAADLVRYAARNGLLPAQAC